MDEDEEVLPKEQVEMLQKVFDTFDREKQGFITAEMVSAMLSMMGLKFNQSELMEVIAEIDEDGSGQIEFDEFLILAKKFMTEDEDEDSGELEKELKEAFRLYDKEGNGYITTKVLKTILAELDSSLSDEDLDGMIEEIDEDGSGTVDFDEFMEMMTGWVLTKIKPDTAFIFTYHVQDIDMLCKDLMFYKDALLYKDDILYKEAKFFSSVYIYLLLCSLDIQYYQIY